MPRGRPRTTPEQFWSRVSTAQSGCWVWLGYQDVEGYGSLRWHGRTVRAHRLAYELTYGPVPADVCVCHTCDVPACVNPQHLWVGTNRDNQDDCTRKGRRPIGERHGSRTHPERVPRGEQHCNAKL